MNIDGNIAKQLQYGKLRELAYLTNYNLSKKAVAAYFSHNSCTAGCRDKDTKTGLVDAIKWCSNSNLASMQNAAYHYGITRRFFRAKRFSAKMHKGTFPCSAVLRAYCINCVQITN